MAPLSIYADYGADLSRQSKLKKLRDMYRLRLAAFYTKYNPDLLPKVDELLEKYSGREVELFAALNAKYVTSPSTATTPSTAMSTAASTSTPRTPRSIRRGLARAASMVASAVQSDVDLVQHRVNLLLGANGIVLDWLQGLPPDARREMSIDVAAALASGETRVMLGAVLNRHRTALSEIALPKGSLSKIDQAQCVRDLSREPLIVINSESFTPTASMGEDEETAIDHVIAEIDRLIERFAASSGDAFEVRKHVMRCAARTTAADGYFALASLVGDAFIVSPTRGAAPISIEISEGGDATIVVPSSFIVRRHFGSMDPTSGGSGSGSGTGTGTGTSTSTSGASDEDTSTTRTSWAAAKEPEQGLLVDVVVTRTLQFLQRSGSHVVSIAARGEKN